MASLLKDSKTTEEAESTPVTTVASSEGLNGDGVEAAAPEENCRSATALGNMPV
jgi:hypothetical protein